MYVITVTFEIDPEHLESFRPLMQKQADNSLKNEAGCQQFDVCYSTTISNHCFLYEKYDDRAAFDVHLAQDYFAEFDAAVTPWVLKKEVHTWEI